MNDLFDAIEATALAQYLRTSVWTYPVVNAGHILGIALLLGSVVPMDLRILGAVRGPTVEATVRFLRPFAIAGAMLAIACGALLFAAQATEYARNEWFQSKMGLLAVAVFNAALHPRIAYAKEKAQRRVAAFSLLLWPLILFSGRMIGYS